MDSKVAGSGPEPKFIEADFDWLPYSARVLRTAEGRTWFVVGNIASSETVAMLKISDVVDFEPALPEVEINWSNCGPKCALYIRGEIRVVVDLDGEQVVVELLRDDDAASNHASQLIRELPLPRDEQSIFSGIRALYWQARVRKLGETPTPLSAGEVATRGFLVSGRGGANLYGVFEQHHDTGDLYVFDRERAEIVDWLQIFTDASELALSCTDVAVVWSRSFERVGVVVCGGLRGVIDIATGEKGRIQMHDRSTRPISHPAWLAGFEWWEQRMEAPRPILRREEGA